MKGNYLHKIQPDLNAALVVLGQYRSDERKLVFTNGCFDILHSGHIQYLNEARNLGDFLIVGVNDDGSVERLKGELRPILPLRERMEILSALEMVDMVIPFSEDTPLTLINAIRPSILVKGGDYEISGVVGADEVLADGGSVELLSFKEGSSTTNVIDEIIKKYS
ncbi:UNVERIFIED_CONTAM: hypothetical protein GTU68_033041 [Idotea baltica]|nr:hypothetical protein [Idotea baltica]